MNLTFERHMDPKASMGIGEKIHLDTISVIEIKLLRKMTADHAHAKILGDFLITGKREGERVLLALKKLSENSDIGVGWTPNETIVINQSKRILPAIFEPIKKYHKKVLKNMTHLEINYKIAPGDQKSGVIGKIAGNVIWKKSDNIFPICVNEIRFHEF